METQTPEPAIRLRDVEKSFKDLNVLRGVDFDVARGSIPYSAVSQPRPPPLSHGGTLSPTLAVHSTWVSPNLTRQDPSAWQETPRSRLIGRSASAARLEGRILGSING